MNVGAETVTGEVTEIDPDESGTPSSLPIAEIEHPTITVVSTGNPLSAPMIIGRGDVLPPAQNIFSGGRTSVDVTTANSFEPLTRPLDFYWGLASTYVEVEDSVAVGPTNDFAFRRRPDNGAGAGLRTPAGGLAGTDSWTVNSRRIAVFEASPELDMTASLAVGVPHGLTSQVAPTAS